MSEKKTAVIIYQMGKVGSTTIHRALENAALPFPVYKVHFLSDEGIRHGEEFHQKTQKIPWENTPHLQTSQQLRTQIETDSQMRWKIITLVRDPISREVSEFFQYIHSLYPELLDAEGQIETARALKMLQAKFMFYNPQKNYACRWFDMEIKEMFGIDVYEHPFDTAAGYSTISHGNVDLLVLRMEDLDKSFSQAITQFLALPAPIELERRNVRTEQKRGDAYQQVLQTLTLRPSICRKVYASAYAQHFYAEAEIEQLVQKWSGFVPA